MLYTHDFRYLLTGAEGVVKVFHTASFTLVDAFRAVEQEICLMLLDAADRYLAVIGGCSLALYDFPTRRLLHHRAFPTRVDVRSAYFIEHAGRQRLLLCSKSLGVFVLSESFEADEPECVAFEPRRCFLEGILIQSRFFLAYTNIGTLCLWDVKAQLDGRPSPARLIALPLPFAPASFENVLVNDEGSLALFIHKNGLCFFRGSFAAANRRDESAAPRALRNLSAETPSAPQFSWAFEHKFRALAAGKTRTSASALNERFAAVAINTAENTESNQEAFHSTAELFFFHYGTDGAVCLLSAIDESRARVNLRVSVFCIESCPGNAEVFAFGDSEGQIVLWSALRGAPLFVSKQFCRHLPLQVAVSNPICDIRFLPGGLEFFASTFYGAMAFYSAFCSDFPAVAFAEQFSGADFNAPSLGALLDAAAVPLSPALDADGQTAAAALQARLLEHGADRHARAEEARRDAVEFEQYFKEEVRRCEERAAELGLGSAPVERPQRAEPTPVVESEEAAVAPRECGYCSVREAVGACADCSLAHCAECKAVYWLLESDWKICVRCTLVSIAESSVEGTSREFWGRKCDRDAFKQTTLPTNPRRPVQVGEQRVFVPGAFRLFLKEFSDVFQPSCLIEFIDSLLAVADETPIEVLDHEPQFPRAAGRPLSARNSALRRLQIFQTVKFRFLDSETLFAVPFNPAASDALFLVPRPIYERARGFVRGRRPPSHATLNGQTVKVRADGGAERLFHSLCASEAAEGDSRISPWLVDECAVRQSPDARLLSILETFRPTLDKHIAKHANFAANVSERKYAEYFDFVAVPISIETLRARCAESYYLSLEELRKDISLIRANTELYNKSEWPPFVEARRIERNMLLSLELAEQRVQSRPTSLANLSEFARPREHRTRTLPNFKRAK